MAGLSLNNLHKAYGKVEVIKGVNLEIEHGEFVVFVGPSGCGKSTLLRMICGLETLTRGDVLIDGVSMRNVDASRRGAAMVFQSYALYPHMTVAENMAFPLRMSGMAKAERMEKARAASAILQMDSYLDRYPRQLSGGQRQRVAIGRAIVRNPKVFLFDEPLSNLDAELRVQMRQEITALHRQLEATMIYVTHDQVEAMTMADRIVVLRSGKIEQVGTPVELFTRPTNLFVAGFVGSPRMNLLAAKVTAVEGGQARLAVPGIAREVAVAAVPGQLREGETATLGLRPEHLAIAPEGPLAAEITFVERLGTTSQLHAPDFPAGPLVVEVRGMDMPGPGRLSFALDLGNARLFDSAGLLATPG